MNYLVIGEITEYEEILSLQFGSDGRTFDVAINAGDTATQLLSMSARGEMLPLVVIVTDAVTYALDDVYVSGATISQNQGTPLMQVTFSAAAVRFV